MASSIVISTPSYCTNEINWVLKVIFTEFLGISYSQRTIEEPKYVIHSGGKTLTLPDQFFFTSQNKWFDPSTLPKLPLENWNVISSGLKVDLVEPSIPVLYGQSGFHGSQRNTSHLALDIFGSGFFMLSRYEELMITERDQFGKIPASASVAHKAGFLNRPIVDEYIEILWAAMKFIWPQLERKTNRGKILISCDVDQPFDRVGSSKLKLLRSLAGDLGRRRMPTLAFNRVRNFIKSPKGNLNYDPYYTFDWYMDVCERNNHMAAFYFITDHTGGAIDGTYNINEPRTLGLIKEIASRGHEIGVHGSYNSFNDPGQILKERQMLIDVCHKLGINAAVPGNRQHYLRWDPANTADYLDAAGYTYDTTGTFADVAGFRYGTAREFPMWSWQKRTGLRINQRPLIIMEISIILACYMNLGYTDKAKETFLELKSKSLKFGGNFSLLWHNSTFLSPKDRDLFEFVVSGK